jgi:protein phosphatase
MLLQRPKAHGPFDIVGDVHGCLDELLALLSVLGYHVDRHAADFAVTPPPGRTLVFVGDLVSRGPATPAVLRLVMNMVHARHALCVPGNQDMRVAAALNAKPVPPTPGLTRTLDQFAAEPEPFRAAVAKFLSNLPGHLVLDNGNLVIAHAGLAESLHGIPSRNARSHAIYGEATGETDDSGLPVRANWAAGYHGHALVVFGHTPVAGPLWLNNTVNIDTGCVYGGRLTALRYPERETVSVPAKSVYFQSRRRISVHRMKGEIG